MMSSLFSFKSKLGFLSLGLLASYMTCSVVNAAALETPIYGYNFAKENVPQNELLLLSIQQLDDDSYLVRFKGFKTAEEKISLTTSRKAVKEALMFERAKKLSRYEVEQE
jgi:hypothetical protein